MATLANISKKVAHGTQVHVMWPFGPLVQETSSDWQAIATNGMYNNDLEASGMKCCYFLFHSEVKFFMHSLFSGERQWPFGPLVLNTLQIDMMYLLELLLSVFSAFDRIKDSKIFQKACNGLLLQSSIGCNGRSRNFAILIFEPRTFRRNFLHGLLIIYSP